MNDPDRVTFRPRFGLVIYVVLVVAAAAFLGRETLTAMF